MEEFSKTDKTFILVSAILIIASAIIFVSLPDAGRPIVVYLFVAISLMITTITSLVMAGFTYSIGKNKQDLSFSGKEGVIMQSTRTTEQDKTLLLGLITGLSALLVLINFLKTGF